MKRSLTALGLGICTLGCLALGGIAVGCSDDPDEFPPPGDTGSESATETSLPPDTGEIDSTVPDTGEPDTDVDTGTPPDGADADTPVDSGADTGTGDTGTGDTGTGDTGTGDADATPPVCFAPSWCVTPSPTAASLYDVWGSGPNDFWAVGNNGTVLHFDGSSWARQTTPIPCLLYTSRCV